MINIPSIKEITQDLKNKSTKLKAPIILGKSQDLIINGGGQFWTTDNGGAEWMDTGLGCGGADTSCSIKTCTS